VDWGNVHPAIHRCIIDLGKALTGTTKKGRKTDEDKTPDYEELTNCIPVHVSHPPLIKEKASNAFAEAWDMRNKAWADDVAVMLKSRQETLSKQQANTLLAIAHALHYCDLDMEKRGLPDRKEKFTELAGGFMHILFTAPAHSENRLKLMTHPDQTFQLISEYGPLLFTMIQITDL